MQLILGQRSLFPVGELDRHVNALGKENIENAGKGPLTFFLHFVVHYSCIDDSFDIFQEVVFSVELLEVINKRRNPKPTKSSLAILKYVCQLEIEFSFSTKFHDVDDEDFVNCSNRKNAGSKHVDAIQVIQHISIHLHIQPDHIRLIQVFQFVKQVEIIDVLYEYAPTYNRLFEFISFDNYWLQIEIRGHLNLSFFQSNGLGDKPFVHV